MLFVVVHGVDARRVFRIRPAVALVVLVLVASAFVILLPGLILPRKAFLVRAFLALRVILVTAHQRVEHPGRFVAHARHRGGVVVAHVVPC